VTKAAKFDDKSVNPNSAVGRLSNPGAIDRINEELNPSHSGEQKDGSLTPFYSTGARAFIKLAGKPLGVCQNITWQVSYQATPVHTIDSVHPWDIDVGAITIKASLSQIMDPTKGAEADALFSTMQAAIHQPMVEMQVLDTGFGTCLFFARGMFTSISGVVARGSISTWNADFVGVAYQHYVSQTFKPYNSLSGGLSDALDAATDLAGTLTGGAF
jgi:hypothetical protein